MGRLAVSLFSLAAASLLLAATANASCAPQTRAEQRARADVIFDGVALEGPTATGVQRFTVTRYLKGRGPTTARVQTGNKVFADGSGVSSSASLVVRKGQRWRIFARGSARKILQTSDCDGSRRR